MILNANVTRSPEAAPEAQPCSVYDVLVNQDEELTLWPANQEIPYSPSGWMPTGKRGTEEDCLEFIEEHDRGVDLQLSRVRACRACQNG